MRFRGLQMWVSWLIFAGVLASSAVARAQSAVPEIYFVPNVETQFNELALRPEPFGFGSPDSFSPTFLDFHYQGVVRKHGPGTPYLFVTRNRDGAGYLLVVRMDRAARMASGSDRTACCVTLPSVLCRSKRTSGTGRDPLLGERCRATEESRSIASAEVKSCD